MRIGAARNTARWHEPGFHIWRLRNRTASSSISTRTRNLISRGFIPGSSGTRVGKPTRSMNGVIAKRPFGMPCGSGVRRSPPDRLVALEKIVAEFGDPDTSQDRFFRQEESPLSQKTMLEQ